MSTIKSTEEIIREIVAILDENNVPLRPEPIHDGRLTVLRALTDLLLTAPERKVTR